MFRRFLDYQLALTEKGKPFQRFRPLVEALDTFFYEASHRTSTGPHIRDAVDVKRWMMIVIFALTPCLLVTIWNTGLQSFVYTSGSYQLMNEYLTASSSSLQDYMNFALKDYRYLAIIKQGLKAVLPIIFISYAVGGLCEAAFAIVRGHEITEGFLVTGILYALILPSTIPYWMVAFGVAFGIILSKEVFGGSGMNIVNPALVCRALLFFTFPGKMSGDVWVGTNPTVVRENLIKMNQEAHTNSLDGYSQATCLARFNIPSEIKRIHTEVIASNSMPIESSSLIEKHLQQWNTVNHQQTILGHLNPEQLQQFITTPTAQGGLGLPASYYEDAYHFTSLNYGWGPYNDWNLFLGNRLGSLGETSILACLMGALILIWTGVGSWRTMAGMVLGAFLTAWLFQMSSHLLGNEDGLWNPATYGFPAYKHFLLGGLMFGLVFMATDPVSSPSMPLARWIYGAFAGMITIIIRLINPAYPEGVMLAILTANVFAPLIDYYVVRFDRRRFSRVRV